MDAFHVFPQCAGCYSLDRGCDWYCDDQSLHWILSRASSSLCGCQSPVWDRVCSPVVGVEAPRSISELWCEVGGTGTLLLREELLCIPPQELSTERCTLWCHLPPVVWAHKVYCCWHCPQPHHNHGNAGNQPRCPSGAVLTKPPAQTHWHRFAEVRHQDCYSHAPGSAVGAMTLAQTLTPLLHAHVPSKSAAADAGPTPAMGAPVICSDVPQALSLQSRWRRISPRIAHTGRWLRF